VSADAASARVGPFPLTVVRRRVGGAELRFGWVALSETVRENRTIGAEELGRGPGGLCAAGAAPGSGVLVGSSLPIKVVLAGDDQAG
jgi:hypothetical protein